MADAGYHFVKWSDDVTANPRTDTGVTADVSVSAIFDISSAITVAQGTVDIGRPTMQYYASRSTTAVADEIVISASGGSSIVDTITVRGLDSSETLTSDVEAVALYRDDGNGIFGTGDVLLSTVGAFSADASGTPVVFPSVGLSVSPGAPVSIWIVYQVAATATDGHSVGSRVLSGDVEALLGVTNPFSPIESANDGATIAFDFTPPSTVASGVAAPWSSTTATISLTATDTFSGVVGTYYELDGGATTTYTAPFEVSAEGTTTVAFWSVDVAGNIETTMSAPVRIDRTAPSTPETPTVSAVWPDSVDLSWPPAVDTLSGVSYYEVLVDHATAATTTATVASITGLSTETSYTISLIAVDAAGNRSAESSPTPVLTLAPRARPSQAVAARSAGVEGVYVNWGESTGTVPPVSYHIWRSAAGSQFSVIATIPDGPVRIVPGHFCAPVRAAGIPGVGDRRSWRGLAERPNAAHVDGFDVAASTGQHPCNQHGVRPPDVDPGAAAHRRRLPRVPLDNEHEHAADPDRHAGCLGELPRREHGGVHRVLVPRRDASTPPATWACRARPCTSVRTPQGPSRLRMARTPKTPTSARCATTSTAPLRRRRSQQLPAPRRARRRTRCFVAQPRSTHRCV